MACRHDDQSWRGEVMRRKGEGSQEKQQQQGCCLLRRPPGWRIRVKRADRLPVTCTAFSRLDNKDADNFFCLWTELFASVVQHAPMVVGQHQSWPPRKILSILDYPLAQSGLRSGLRSGLQSSPESGQSGDRSPESGVRRSTSQTGSSIVFLPSLIKGRAPTQRRNPTQVVV